MANHIDHALKGPSLMGLNIELSTAEQISVATMFGLGRRSIWSRASPGRCRHVKPAEKIEREH
jgi:hypothetical protein